MLPPCSVLPKVQLSRGTGQKTIQPEHQYAPPGFGGLLVPWSGCQPPEAKLVSRSSGLQFAGSSPSRHSALSDKNDRDQLSQSKESVTKWDSSYSCDFCRQLVGGQCNPILCGISSSDFTFFTFLSSQSASTETGAQTSKCPVAVVSLQNNEHTFQLG